MSAHRRTAAAALLVLAACSSGNKGSTTSTTGTSATASSTATSAAASGAGGWPTYHHDVARTGVADDQEPLGQVRKAWDSPTLDGEVYAQPLVVGNRVIVATEGNSVYALDAASGAVAWRARFGTPVDGGSLPCGNIDPSGITGTPVADPATSTVYAVAFLSDGPHHELYAVDLGNGNVRWHRAIDPPGLSARVEQERAALTLAGGRIYVPYGGLFGDCGNYKGAVVSARADGHGNLDSYVVPTAREAGIWAPGGAVTDAAGDLWVTTGNSASQGAFDYGNAVIRLSPELDSRDYFAPRDWARLNSGDVDLGSVAPILVGTNRVVAAGKGGTAYLLDRAHLGGIGGALDETDACSSAFGTAAVQGSTAYLPCSDALVALRVDGNKLTQVWRHSGQAGPSIIAAGSVWVVGSNGRLIALDPANGQSRFSAQVGEPVSQFVTPSAAGGRLFVPSGDRITAFALR